jgi:hypothetical protein
VTLVRGHVHNSACDRRFEKTAFAAFERLFKERGPRLSENGFQFSLRVQFALIARWQSTTGARNIIGIMPEADFLAKRQKHYANVLNDLFDPTPHMNSIRIFEFVCALVRAGGLELGGFDPWYESKAIIDDIRNLSQLALPEEHFPEPVKTRIRLALVAYCTLTEMDLPYVLIANLLRLRCGEKYHLDPFHDLAQKRPPKKGQAFGKVIPPTPSQKIKRITELAKKANMEAIGAALAENYDSVLRNAVYHSDYVLHDDSLIIRKD